MKKKAKTFDNEEVHKEVFETSKKTIEVLTNNMISGDVTLKKLFEFYQESNRANAIKLLLRCKKMYEARVDVKSILLSIIQKEEFFNQVPNGVHHLLENIKK